MISVRILRWIEGIRMQTHHQVNAHDNLPPLLDLSIVRDAKICPFSCSFLLFFKPYSTQFLNPYRLPNWWYLRLGIRVITHSFEFFGSVSGSVVISQNCSARRLPKIFSRMNRSWTVPSEKIRSNLRASAQRAIAVPYGRKPSCRAVSPCGGFPR